MLEFIENSNYIEILSEVSFHEYILLPIFYICVDPVLNVYLLPILQISLGISQNHLKKKITTK